MYVRWYVFLTVKRRMVADLCILLFFFSSRRRHTRYWRDWSSDVCSSDLRAIGVVLRGARVRLRIIRRLRLLMVRPENDAIGLCQRGCDLLCDVALYGKEIARTEIFVVGSRPEHGPLHGIQQADTGPQSALGHPDAALDGIPDSELTQIGRAHV